MFQSAKRLLGTQRLGRGKFTPEERPFLLSEELPGSLRQLKPQVLFHYAILICCWLRFVDRILSQSDMSDLISDIAWLMFLRTFRSAMKITYANFVGH